MSKRGGGKGKEERAPTQEIRKLSKSHRRHLVLAAVWWLSFLELRAKPGASTPSSGQQSQESEDTCEEEILCQTIHNPLATLPAPLCRCSKVFWA